MRLPPSRAPRVALFSRLIRDWLLAEYQESAWPSLKQHKYSLAPSKPCLLSLLLRNNNRQRKRRLRRLRLLRGLLRLRPRLRAIAASFFNCSFSTERTNHEHTFEHHGFEPARIAGHLA